MKNYLLTFINHNTPPALAYLPYFQLLQFKTEYLNKLATCSASAVNLISKFTEQVILPEVFKSQMK